MRAETLTHESVLFSALSFSAFLSLVISDLFDIKKLRFEESTFSRIYYYSEIVVSGKIRESNIDFPNLLRVNAVDIISVFLLLCATFFLCTIIARARFNDRYHDAENLLSAAQKLNEKEEEALRAGKDEEKIKYNAAIYNMIDSIEKLESSLIVPVIQMRINRNIGLLCFMICLVVCGNMFSIYIAGGIIFILTFSIGAAVIDNIWRDLLRGAVFDENGILKLLNPVSKRP